MMHRYRARRGNEEDFSEDMLVPGEFAEILDKHTLVFCFEKGKVSYLNIDESVDNDKADELIFRIKQYIENSHAVAISRMQGKREIDGQ